MNPSQRPCLVHDHGPSGETETLRTPGQQPATSNQHDQDNQVSRTVSPVDLE